MPKFLYWPVAEIAGQVQTEMDRYMVMILNESNAVTWNLPPRQDLGNRVDKKGETNLRMLASFNCPEKQLH